MTSCPGNICGTFPRTEFISVWLDCGENELEGTPEYLAGKGGFLGGNCIEMC